MWQNLKRMDRINFIINQEKFSVGGEFEADTTLNDFIRQHVELRGTKYMCKEGGCGACVVNVRAAHPTTGEVVSFSVNSCLVLVTSCNDWDITTIEGIGNRKIGYHIIQKRLNHYFGSQCGHCSPGFVMSMYSLVHSKNWHLSEAEIEKSFGSNLCRCTGYRPILEAFKSLAVDAKSEVLQKIKDIEDIDENVCPKSGKKCGYSCKSNESQEWCLINVKRDSSLDISLPKKIKLADGRLWYAATDINTIFKVLDDTSYDSYMLVAGNTARGVRPIISYPMVLIDVTNVKELRSHYLDVNLVLGANTTLTDTMSLFKQLSNEKEEFWYLKVLYNHIEKVAHIPVRNTGTLAGNLMLKHSHPDFPSDIFLLFDCVGAFITLVDRNNQATEMSFVDFMKSDVKGKVLKNIMLPPLSTDNKVVTYKITAREQNAHAEVNAAYLFKFDSVTNKIQNARIVYGNIAPNFTHAYNTEKYLIGKYLFDNEVLQNALHSLTLEIKPVENPPEPSASFRKKLAINLFYKSVIKLCPLHILSPFYISGATTPTEDRPPVSNSYQEYETDKNKYPLTQPHLKREGMIQCAGEAVYTEDMPTIKNEVFAAFVISHVSEGDIESIDKSEALKINGVVAVLTSKDIPGENNVVLVLGFILLIEREEILASKKVRYYGQPVAIVVATTQAAADRATNFVKVNYKNVPNRLPVLTIDDAIKAPKLENRLTPYDGITPTDKGGNVKKIIRGHFYSPLQYHFMMEVHTAVTIPVDEGLEIYTSTQHVDATQAVIGQMLDLPESKIIVINRRCGGAFGCKISRGNFVACATALVAKKLDRPCRMAMRLPDITRALGKRSSSRYDYEVGVDDKGEIQYMNAVLYINDGLTRNENENGLAINNIRNCYDTRRWKVDSFSVITDMPTNCFMRAPGSFEAIGAIEHVMERIAIELKRDPISVRMANYRRENNDLPELVPIFKERIDFEKRKQSIDHFNADNRWKKRSLKIINMSFELEYIGNYSALVSVYHGDGSVVVSIGGIEIGQGVNTRIIQVAAYELQVPVEKVSVTPVYNFATPNHYATASSITIECCAYCVIRCCQQIKARLVPVKAAMPKATWQEIVFAADQRGINLQANYLTSPNDPRLVGYPIYGLAAVEVEIDVLTGRKWIVRADVFEDAGQSINPALDVGQVEGAFVQGLSAWILEELKFDEHTGDLLTNRTWNYKIFGAKDIPHDFRVYLRKRTYNPVGILGSKAIGEPPTCMTYIIVECLREAIQCSRHDGGEDTDKYLELDVPVTNEHVLEAADVKIEELLLY